MDGRDIGTVVFPQAELKIFLTADNAVRVERRFKELFEKNPNITIEEIKANLEMRDYIDSNREESPLRKADDAILVDNTNMTARETIQKVAKLAKQIITPWLQTKAVWILKAFFWSFSDQGIKYFLKKIGKSICISKNLVYFSASIE